MMIKINFKNILIIDINILNINLLNLNVLMMQFQINLLYTKFIKNLLTLYVINKERIRIENYPKWEYTGA